MQKWRWHLVENSSTTNSNQWGNQKSPNCHIPDLPFIPKGLKKAILWGFLWRLNQPCPKFHLLVRFWCIWCIPTTEIQDEITIAMPWLFPLPTNELIGYILDKLVSYPSDSRPTIWPHRNRNWNHHSLAMIVPTTHKVVDWIHIGQIGILPKWFKTHYLTSQKSKLKSS